MPVDDLIAFVTARLDEAVAAAEAATQSVLKDVAAKRALLKLHEPVLLRAGSGAKYYDTIRVCRSCEPHTQFRASSWPCATVRHLAVINDGHPDYKDDWRLRDSDELDRGPV